MLIQASSALAEASDREAILAVMDEVFAAVSSQNPDDWRAIQLAEGTTISFRALPEGAPDAFESMRMTSNEKFLASLAPDGRKYVERWTGEPTILIRGPIAVIWGEYEFWLDDEFSHCGVDSADLVKSNGQWKVANLMWTVETVNCPTAPAD